jgi:hypothetical protein
MLNPWVLLAALVAALGCFGAGFWLGGGYAKTECVAGQVQAQQAGVAQAATESGRREAVGAARETSREQIRVVYRTLREQAGAVQVVAGGADIAGCELDVDGLRLWNAANRGGAAPLPSEPNSGVSNTTTGTVGEVGGFVGQPHRGDGVGSAVSGPASEAGGMYQPQGSAKP